MDIRSEIDSYGQLSISSKHVYEMDIRHRVRFMNNDWVTPT
jgi:hypothetical protein